MGRLFGNNLTRKINGGIVEVVWYGGCLVTMNKEDEWGNCGGCLETI